MKQVAVVVPFYKDHLTKLEKISLIQGFQILGAYSFIAIKPAGLDLSFLNEYARFTEIKSFDDTYFKDINGYNRLMMSKSFYEAFLGYEYILIYQLDAFVFSDQLKYWCEQGYDYIGAPWLYPVESILHNMLFTLKGYLFRRFNIKSNGNPKKKQFYNVVGNGGFSLRRVQKFFELSIRFKWLADQYIARQKKEFNEDVFWSIAVNRRKKHLKIPGYRIAIKFAYETDPYLAYSINQNALPFGCHAWDKQIDFWREEFRSRGYDL
jgi:hypothetical protein